VDDAEVYDIEKQIKSLLNSEEMAKIYSNIVVYGYATINSYFKCVEPDIIEFDCKDKE